MYLWAVFKNLHPQKEPIGLDLRATDSVGKSDSIESTHIVVVVVF